MKDQFFVTHRCTLLLKLLDRYSIYSGFRGLMVSILASRTQVRGFKPDRSRRIFRAKKFSVYLPSEGKKSRLSHVAALRHVK
jgi:hypothetical protein